MKLENERLKSENGKLAQRLNERSDLQKENHLKTEKVLMFEAEDKKEEPECKQADEQLTPIEIIHEQLDFSTRSSVIINNLKLADPIIKTDELWFNQFESLKEQVYDFLGMGSILFGFS